MLSFTSRFPLFHCRPMEWSEEHVLFLRGMLASIFLKQRKEVPTNSKAVIFAMLHNFVSLHFESCKKTKRYYCSLKIPAEYLRESA